ncbi:SWIM zinc finger family protein [Streptomyces flavofungini]|uniref:SWIM zinc finger family protein n=1 Tax=Streptomyces flavofungini TaxID=68200 RepID=UPI0025AF11C8|nr:SWIM zinc finger family protein [Streptomyces flavofungini]WJV49441.1 hypothetical protein QUY26_30355 [Streptomyces flavofungini]
MSPAMDEGASARAEARPGGGPSRAGSGLGRGAASGTGGGAGGGAASGTASGPSGGVPSRTALGLGGGARSRVFPALPPRTGLDAPFASTWWGNAWIAALEDSALDPARLARGRAYAREGHVDTITVAPGRIVAYVHGSRPRPYRAELRMRTLTPADWDRLLDAAVADPAHLTALLTRDMPEALATTADRTGVPLLPGHGDLVPSCACPDRGHPCKHAAALTYQTARILDADPFVLLLVRGADETRVLDELARRNAHFAAREATPRPPAAAYGERRTPRVPSGDTARTEAAAGGAVSREAETGAGAAEADEVLRRVPGTHDGSGTATGADDAFRTPASAQGDAARPATGADDPPGTQKAARPSDAVRKAIRSAARAGEAARPAPEAGDSAYPTAAPHTTPRPSDAPRSTTPRPSDAARNAIRRPATADQGVPPAHRQPDSPHHPLQHPENTSPSAQRSPLPSAQRNPLPSASESPLPSPPRSPLPADPTTAAPASPSSPSSPKSATPALHPERPVAAPLTPPPLPGVPARDVLSSDHRPPLPPPFPVPQHPGEPPVLPAGPGAPDATALEFLATDAAVRAHAHLRWGESPFAVDAWLDAVRLAASHPGLTGRRTFSRQFAALAASVGRAPADLSRAAAAWRQGGEEGLAVLESPWDPPAGPFDRARGALAAAHLPRMTIHHNHLTDPTASHQIRYGHDGRWYPYRGETHAGRTDWWPDGSADEDPVGALTGLLGP